MEAIDYLERILCTQRGRSVAYGSLFHSCGTEEMIPVKLRAHSDQKFRLQLQLSKVVYFSSSEFLSTKTSHHHGAFFWMSLETQSTLPQPLSSVLRSASQSPRLHTRMPSSKVSPSISSASIRPVKFFPWTVPSMCLPRTYLQTNRILLKLSTCMFLTHRATFSASSFSYVFRRIRSWKL